MSLAAKRSSAQIARQRQRRAQRRGKRKRWKTPSKKAIPEGRKDNWTDAGVRLLWTLGRIAEQIAEKARKLRAKHPPRVPITRSQPELVLVEIGWRHKRSYWREPDGELHRLRRLALESQRRKERDGSR